VFWDEAIEQRAYFYQGFRQPLQDLLCLWTQHWTSLHRSLLPQMQILLAFQTYSFMHVNCSSNVCLVSLFPSNDSLGLWPSSSLLRPIGLLPGLQRDACFNSHYWFRPGISINLVVFVSQLILRGIHSFLTWPELALLLCYYFSENVLCFQLSKLLLQYTLRVLIVLTISTK
jgi:hypothetical protein